MQRKLCWILFGLQTLLGGWMQNHLKVWTKENRVWAWTIPEPYHQRNINNLVKATFHSFPLGLIFYLFQKLFADNTASCNAGDIVEQIILCPKQLHGDSFVLKLSKYFQTSSLPFNFHHVFIPARQNNHWPNHWSCWSSPVPLCRW